MDYIILFSTGCCIRNHAPARPIWVKILCLCFMAYGKYLHLRMKRHFYMLIREMAKVLLNLLKIYAEIQECVFILDEAFYKTFAS